MKKEINVLVLEDFAPDADLMMHELRRAGYLPEWQRIQTEEEFIDALDSDWDLILADFTLPQFDAISALTILKEAKREIPLIIVTGTISEDAALRCIQMGAADYLLKDRLTRLAAAVQHVLEEQFLREAKEKTEEALVQSEERFFRLAENATDIFCNIRVSPDIHVDYINPAIVRVLGYSPQEIRQKPHKIVEKVRDSQKKTLINLLEDRLPFQKPYVFQWQAKDGSWKWIECSVVAIRDKNGQLAALEVVGRDVNDRVEAELALQDAHRLLEQRVEERTRDLREAKEAVQLSEERFRVALANAPLVVSTLDKDLRYTWVYKGSELKDVATVGKTDEEFLPPEDAVDLVRLKREVLAKGQPIRREVRLRLDGEDRYYDASVEPLRDGTGEIIGVTSARMDITDRKRWERILFEATQRLEQHMNNSPLAILELDPSSKIIRWNDGAERMFGFSAAEVMGKKLSDFKFLHEEDAESIYQAIGIATASKTFRTFNENRNYRKDGSVVYCQWFNSILFDENGIPQSVLSQGLNVTEKTLAERELIKAKERLSTILESITDAFMALDRDFRFTYVSQTAANLTRQTIENMTGRYIWDVFPEAIGSTFQQMYERSMRENVTLEFEEFYPPFNAWYSVTCYPSTDGLSIFFDDVTARHEMLDKLRESEMQFRQIAENISEVLWMVDVKTEEYIYVSPNLAQVVGHHLTKFQDFLDIVHPEDRKLMRASRKKVLHGDYDEEFRIIRENGDVAWLRARTFPIRDAQGEIYRIVGIAEDITARREFEEQRERLAAIVNFSHDGMVRVTLDGIVTDWNHGAELLYGWSAHEAIGRSIFDLIIPPEEVETTREFIARIIAGESFEAEAERICKNGRRMDISMTVSPIRDSDGNVVAISKVERDITQRKMAEESLRLSEERFHVALSDSPITVFNQDMELRFTWVHNPPDHLASEMMLGCTVFDFFAEEDAQRVNELSKEVLDLDTPHRCEARMLVDGRTLHYDIYLEPLRDANGNIVGLTGAAIDITASKEVAAELAKRTQEIRRERRQLRSVLQVLPVAVFIADASGKIIETNEAAQELWGGQTPLIDVENFNLYKGWFKDTGQPLGSHDWAMAQALTTGREPPVQEIEIECFDGTHRTILNMAQPILSNSGEVMGAVAICHDITERTQITEQLRETNERLEERVKQRTAYIELLRSVTQIANESLDMHDALRKTLEVVCHGMNWQVGHAFIVEDDSNPILIDTGIWHLPEEDPSRYALLIERTANARTGFPKGLIGKVQALGEPQWIADISDSDEFLRAHKGDDFGVTTAMAFPVLIEKSVVAVLEFFCVPKCEPDPTQLELMSNIGVQFGRAVERQRLQRQLTQAVLNEQRRLGHELHDSVGQALAGLAMKTKSLHKRLIREGSAEAEAIGNLMDQLSESVVHVRAIARGLFPVEIDANGLKAALVDLARQTRERYGIACDCQFRNEAVVSDNNAATHLFRIAQEAVSNAVRHGNPEHILIHLEAEGRSFRLEVEDDGTGMDQTQTTRSGIGLSIMRYRARIIDAVLEIESTEKGGVRIICTR